jgi:CBS domain-containing protein
LQRENGLTNVRFRGGCELPLERMNVAGTIESILNQKKREVWSVSPDATVYDAVAMMAEKNVGALLVVEDGGLVGVISERDYTRKIMLHGKRSRETQVREIMSTELTTVDPKEGVDECLRFMTDKRVRHLPVVKDGEICGVVSIGDLVKHVISVQSATLDQLERYISGGYVT